MKKTLLITMLLLFGTNIFAQHLYEHDYPVISSEDPEIRTLMDSVSIDSIKASIEHLSSYHTRRYDSHFIYDVQDWLVARYQSMGIDTVVLHDFPIPDSEIETADNIIAVQWGTKKPEEFVVCGAHYDSWNADGFDPDTIRSPGADDNASGVAGILEIARFLTKHKFDRSIIYANWCAEEIGLVGSAAYARDCAIREMDIVGYFNLDMTGYLKEGDDIHVNLMFTTRDSLIGDYVFNFSHVYYPEMRIWQDWLAWGDSDYSSFNRNGYAAVHTFEDVDDSSPFIHTRQDVLGLSVNNLDQSKRFTELNLGLVATLAGLSHQSVPENESIQVAIYPNPAKDQVNIVAEDGLQNITVYNLLGQCVDVFYLNGENKMKLNTISYSTGLYQIRIVTKKGVVSKPLMIQ